MATTQSQTGFVLVPGSFSPASAYERVVPELNKRGYHDVLSIGLKSAICTDGDTERPPPATLYDDAAQIADAVKKLADQGKDVVIAMNSYGGFPGSQAAKGLSKTDRADQGQKGGIIGMVYIASFLPPEGMSLKLMMGENLPDSIKNAGEYMTLDPNEVRQNIFSDMSEDESEHWMKRMGNHSTESFSGKVTYPAYMYIPTTYVMTLGDKIVPPEMQKGMIDGVTKSGAKINIVEVDASHVPMISVPQKIADILINVATAGDAK